MPAIDTDLFQVLALALLFLTLLTLLAALSVLSSIKKELTPGSQRRASSGPPTTTSTSSYDYSPPSTSVYEPAYSAPAATTPEVSTGFVSVADAVVTPAPAAASSGAGLRGDEPEEQPFERDGRWWFKRGGELLVYDEGTGQWVAAPGSASGVGATQTSPTTTVTATADVGEGWKCSSCGAVNGSTATSCRMCFAPR